MNNFFTIISFITVYSTFSIVMFTWYYSSNSKSDLPPSLPLNTSIKNNSEFNTLPLNLTHHESENVSTSYQRISAKPSTTSIYPDPSKLGNFPSFVYVLNRDICLNHQVDMLILVGSHPQHSDLRNVIRHSWGLPRMDRFLIKLVFLFGSPLDAHLQQNILEEHTGSGDIVQGNFKDDYKNVTLRDLMGFRWAWMYCPQARFITRTDDDVIMSVDHIIDALEEQMPKDQDYLACYVHYVGTPVLREGRYGLSREEHPNDIYDHYCQVSGICNNMNNYPSITNFITVCSAFTICMFMWYNINLNSELLPSLPVKSSNKNLTKKHITSFYPDPSTLGKIPNFAYVLNRDICSNNQVDMLILVGSHPQHSALRNVFRNSWGLPRMDKYIIKLVFLFGSPADAKLQQKVLDEHTEFGDIVQGNFKDDYKNVTLRDLMGFRWAWMYCPQARFITRTDDDVIMSVDHIIDALEEQMPKDQDYLACYVHYVGTPVLREGRYGLSREEHPNDIYDHYCQGWTYWLTTGTAKILDRTALKVTPYWVNDAYLTGTLISAIGWQHLTLEINSTNDNQDFVKYLNSSEDSEPKFIHGYNGEDVELTRLTQEKLRNYCRKNGIPRHKPTH